MHTLPSVLEMRADYLGVLAGLGYLADVEQGVLGLGFLGGYALYLVP